MNVNMSELTTLLDRGDGICHHFNMESHLCSIYEKRPDICRVDLQYEKFYSEIYTWDKFVELNLAICNILPDKRV